jgi:hypothetical protein
MIGGAIMLKQEKCNAKRKLVGSKESDMTRRTILGLAVLLVCALTAVSGAGLIRTPSAGEQVGGGNATQPPNNGQAGGSTQQNNGQNAGDLGPEKALVKRPIVMTIATKGSNFEPKDRYKVGDKVLVEVTMTNMGAEPLEVSIGNSYFQDRPRIRKDGKLVPYRKELPALLREKDKYPGPLGSTRIYKLDPNVPLVVHRFLLEDWYEQLEPGQYELTLRHRFWGKEVPADSNTVTFEVTP